jgi:hypothetical protein
MSVSGIKMNIIGEINESLTINRNVIHNGEFNLKINFNFIPHCNDLINATLVFSLNKPNFSRQVTPPSDGLTYHCINPTLLYVDLSDLQDIDTKKFHLKFETVTDFTMGIRLEIPNVSSNREVIYFT